MLLVGAFTLAAAADPDPHIHTNPHTTPTTITHSVLQHRGQAGGLQFDYKEKELNLHVQKDAQDESTQSNNVKELSGGERSFTTLALLLALGESIESPFRGACCVRACVCACCFRAH